VVVAVVEVVGYCLQDSSLQPGPCPCSGVAAVGHLHRQTAIVYNRCRGSACVITTAVPLHCRIAAGSLAQAQAVGLQLLGTCTGTQPL
jgi:uncharacterized metal-binding protein